MKNPLIFIKMNLDTKNHKQAEKLLREYLKSCKLNNYWFDVSKKGVWYEFINCKKFKSCK